MAQTTQLLPSARAFYKKTFGKLGMDRAVRDVLEYIVNAYAGARGFSFPRKFNWEWKLEMLLGKYEHETTTFFKNRIAPGMVIVDIGAHIGYFTRLFSSCTGPSGQVYAFEADAENFALLERNTKAHTNVVHVPTALGDHEGTIDFYHLEGSTGCHSTIAPETRASKTIVPLATLDAILAERKVTKVDLIKMDIEGGEPNALAGMQATLDRNPDIMLVTEFNPTAIQNGGVSPASFIRSLEALGFSIFAITEEKLIPTSAESIMEQLPHFHRTGYINLFCARIRK